MWMTMAFTYLTIGLILVLFTRARSVIGESMADVTTNTHPVWKVVSFRLILNSASVLFWPFFIYGWLSKPRTVWDTLTANPIFRQQNDLAEAMSLLCEDAGAADELPNAEGEFGMSPSNPILCKTVFGSTAYLSRLRALDGTKVVYERVGSTTSDMTPHPVDMYEISHPNGDRLATLYISPYYKRNSAKVPQNFQFAAE
jgi:hypothetical protein